MINHRESMRYSYILYTILLLTLMVCGCEQQNRRILPIVETVINQNPDSAAMLLAKIENPEELSDAERAEYYFLSAKAHRMKGQAMTEDSTIIFSLDYYKKHQDEDKTLNSYYLAINYYLWKNDTANYQAIIGEGIEYAEQQKDSVAISRFYEDMAYKAYQDRDYQASVDLFKQALSFNESYHWYYMLALNDYLLGKNDSLDSYTERAIDLALQEKDTAQACHYLRNYAGMLHHDKKNNYKAIEQLRRAAQLSNEYKDFHPSHLIMTEIYLSLGNLDSAQYYLNKANDSNERLDKGLTVNADYSFTKNTIALLENVISYKRDNKLNLVPISRYNDSIIIEIYKHNLKLEEQILTKEQFKQKSLQLTIDKQQTQLYITIALSLLIIAVGAVCWYIMNRRAKLQETQERVDALQQLLKDASGSRAHDKEDSFFFRRILLQQLGIIRLVATSPTEQNQEFLRQMAALNNEEALADSLLVWDDLYPVIDSIYDDFYTELKQTYGDVLLEKEIQLCCLLCAEFSTKEISVVTQQSVRTIYQRKTTIRQKLQMDEKEDIVDYIKSQINA